MSVLKAHGWDNVQSVAMLFYGVLRLFQLADWGSPFVPQVPGYLKTHAIHSFLTILNYKTVCAWRCSIMAISPVPNQPKKFKFPQRSFGQKNPVKRNAQSSWFANRTWLHYDEANDLAYCHVCMLLTETESWTVLISIKRSYSMDFPTGKMAFNTTLPGAIVIRWGVEIDVFSTFVLSDSQT